MPVDQLDPVVVGRQSIHDRDLAVVGYELRFAKVNGAAARDDAPAGMTSSVVFGALSIGVDRLVGDKRLFCNADRALLVGSAPVTLLPARSVIEVTTGMGVDEDVVAGCRRLIGQGFTIALDDFHWYDGAESMLQLASIVKIDVNRWRGDELAGLTAQCRQFGVQLLAEKVETAHDLDATRALGFDLFQGYALQRPTVESGRAIAAGDLSRLHAASSLLGQALDFDEIEAVLRTEPGLTYQVMQLASIGNLGETRRRISSLRDALVLAGSWRIQNWISLLVARPADGSADDVTTALARASAVEMLAAALDRAAARLGFAAGMLSSFEQLLRIPADELSRTLPLSDELKLAAFGDETPLGRIVRDVADHQEGTQFPRMRSGLSRAELDAALAVAFQWAAEASAALD